MIPSQNVQDGISFNFQEIPIDSYTDPNELNNTFAVFKTLDNLVYLVFADNQKNIIIYNLIDINNMAIIKKAHKGLITNFRYFSDKNNKRDLLMSISADNKELKIWNINTIECLLALDRIFPMGQVYSACLLEDNNQIFVVACHNLNFGTPEAIKVYDLGGKKIKELDDLRCSTNYVDCFYDKKLKKILS